MKNQNAEFEALYAKAWQAGVKAVEEMAPPVPMIVGTPTTLFGTDIDYTKKTYFVADGVCGFAWVWIKGNTAFGRWAKKNGKAYGGYPTGLNLRIHAYNQSMQKKETHAYAMAEVLREAGITAYGQSRMD